MAAALIAMLGTWQIVQGRTAVLMSAEDSVRHLTQALAQHASRAIQQADTTLIDAGDRSDRGYLPGEVVTDVARKLARLRQVSGLMLTDAAGVTTAASSSPFAVDQAVSWHRAHVGDEPFITSIDANGDGQQGLSLSRRLDPFNDRFTGVVAAKLDARWFQAFYRDAKIGRDGTAALWTLGGELLVRFPAPAIANGLGSITSTTIAAANTAGIRAGVHRMRSPLDDIDRILAFERVDDYPIYVSAAVAVHEALAVWQRNASIEGAAVALVSTALVILGFWIERGRRLYERLQDASREADRRYRLLAENSGDFICVTSPNGDTRRYTSPSSLQIIGWSPDELAAMPLSAIVHSEDADRIGSALETLDRAHPRFTTLYRVLHKDGHPVWIEGAFQVMDDGNILWAGRDVSARQAAETALLESETRLRLLADAASDVVQLVDLEGTRRYVSPSATEILGFKPEELVGTNKVDFVAPEDASRFTALLADLGAGRRSQARSIHRARHKAGHYLWVETQYRLVRDGATGAPAEIVASLRDITEREELRHKVEETNRHLLLAEAIAHVGHWHIDLQRNHVSWSDEIYRIHGLDPAAFTPTLESGMQLYHPDDRLRVKRCLADAFSNGKAFDCRLRIVRPDGAIRSILSQGRCEIDPASGRVFALFGAIVDITDQTETERALKEKSALLQATLDNMDQGLIKISVDGTVELANQRVRDLLRLPGENAEAAWPKFTAQLAVGSREFRLPGGIVLEARTVPMPDGSTVSTFQDISARRRAEIAVRESQARYQIITDMSSDMITQLDLSFNRMYVSPSCEKIVGFTPEELVGKRPSFAAHPEDAPQLRALAERLVQGGYEGDRTHATYRTLHKDGHYVWVEAAISLVRDEGTGEAMGLISSVRDVTERQRTARHLLRAKTAAEEAARTKSEFVANMSHELRTPLTGILGVHDLLRTDPALSPSQRRLLGLANESGQTLLRIVNDVLDLSKLEAGQCTIEAIPFDLRSVVATCQGLVREGLQGKTITIASSYPPGIPDWFLGDPGRVRQVLLNLLTNAAKFTSSGRIDVDVSFDPETEAVTVGVTDTGIGINEDKLPLLFERFSQADSSTSRRFGGTGLGLAICRSLVELMGGRIGVRSQSGKGSRFWFSLPLRRLEAARPDIVQEPAMPSFHRSRRILLAEDNLINQEVISAMLTSRGHSVTIVSDGAAAVEIVESGSPFDLILMDVQMPGVDGLHATAAIRRMDEDKARLPIVGLTANAMMEDVERCLAAGMNGHVAKPIEWPTLFAAIDAEVAA